MSNLLSRMATRLSLLARFTRQTKIFMKCSDLSHKIFALNKGIRLTSLHLGKLRRIASRITVRYFRRKPVVRGANRRHYAAYLYKIIKTKTKNMLKNELIELVKRGQLNEVLEKLGDWFEQHHSDDELYTELIGSSLICEN